MAETKEKVPTEDTSNSEPQGDADETPKGDTDANDGKELTQDKVDEVVKARLDRERDKFEKELTKTLKQEREKWEEQSKMSQEEREKALLKEKEAENQEREQKLTLRENKLDAIEKLEEEGIPNATRVADFLIDLDKETQDQSVTSFIETTKEIVQELVDKEVRGETPRAVAPNKGDTPTREVPHTL